MPRLSHDQRIGIATLHREGVGIQELARRYGVHRSNIYRLCRRLEDTGSTDDRRRSGRPRVSNVHDNRILRRMSVAQPNLVARDLRHRWSQEHGVEASTRTVARRLVEMGQYGRIAVRKPLLSARHRQRRLQFARQHLNWTVHQWRHVVFSDETPLHLIQNRQRRYVRRQRGATLQRGMTRPTVHSGCSRQVWGAFAADGTRVLHTIQGNVNADGYVHILTQHLLGLNLPQRRMIFMHDNATPHTSRRTVRFLDENNIQLLPWPPQSPDLNPIENLWGYLKGKLENLQIHSTVELLAAAHREWAAIPVEVLEQLVQSMPHRMAAVVASGGGSTKY